jgi:outer membrane lipoprotein LolB
MQKKYVLIILYLCGWLSACTTLQPAPSPSVMRLTHFTIRGRAAINTPTQHESVSFFWQQRGANYQLRLFGPLGIGAVQLVGNARQVVLSNYQGKQITAISAEDLLQQNLGWSIPVRDLRYWLWAMPTPHLAAQTLPNPPAPLQVLRQAGWQITYANYQGSPSLPHLLICQRPNLEIRLVIDQWLA